MTTLIIAKGIMIKCISLEELGLVMSPYGIKIHLKDR